MKKLYFIIAIFVALFTTQNIFAELTYNIAEPALSNGVWYNAIWTGEHNLQGGENKNNLNFYFPPHTNGTQSNTPYPSDEVKFQFKTNSLTTDDNRYVYIDKLVGSNWSNHTNGKVNKDKTYSSFTKSIPEDARAIAFKSYGGSSGRYIKDVYIRMAPHIRLNTVSLTFSNTAVGTTENQYIDFNSFLAGPGGLIVSIENDPEELFSLEMDGSKGRSITKKQHTFESQTSNLNNIKVIFNPKNIQADNKKCKIKITTKKNDGSTQISETVEINYTSALNPPTLSLQSNGTGYEVVHLQWTAIDGAQKYNLYDNGTKIGTYTGTTAVVTGLAMGSNHKYTVTSIYGSAESKHSNTINVTTNSYPKTSSVIFSNVQQNQFTINWNKVNITAKDHKFNRYQIHIYYYDYWGNWTHFQNVYVTDNNQTSYTVTGIDDATMYDVYVGVDFQYTANGATKSFDVASIGTQWVNSNVTTPSFIGSQFDGVQIYKGEWHRIEAGISHEMGIGEGCQITLKEYPCENLQYRAWCKRDVSGNHFISEDATNKEYLLGGGDAPTYLEGNKFKTPIEPIKPEYVNINFQSRREWGTTAIYVSDMYAKIAPHIKIKSNAYIENALYPYIPFGKIRLNGESVTATINFQSFLVFNELKVTSSNPKFKLSKSVIAPATTSKAGTFCKQGETKYDFTITFTPDELGSHSSRITITDGMNSIAFTVDATVYSKNRLHVAGDWNNSSNWFFGVPAPTEDVEIAAAVTIPNGYTAITNDVSIESGGSISIAPQGALKVNTISGANANNLSLQANENGSATLLFKNTDKVNASIQLYSIASSDGLRDSIAGNFKDPKWQYLGIIAESAQYSALNPDGTTNWMYRWDETKNSTSCWAEKLKSGSTLSAWIGYGIAQEKATLYNYSGTLINSDHTYSLTFTSNDGYTEDRGYNLITNSYSAPIDIATINTTNFVNAVENIYIYNTGSYAEWRDNNNSFGFGPGQMIPIPVNSISALGNEYPHTIPSGQAFFVKANNNSATFTVNYNSNVYNATNTATQKRAPKADSNEFNVLKIQVTSTTSNDRLYLLEHENCTPNFDNGYDAEKIFDNPNGPQIYASNTFGYTSINTDTTFNGQTIGFIANSESEIYTMTFDIEKLHSYDEIYLYDSQTGIYTNILEEELYQFYGNTTPNNNRFTIVAKQSESPESNTTTSIELVTWEDIISQNETIYLYTTTGQLINILHPNSTIDLTVPAGIYIVKCGDKTLKVRI